MMFKKINYSDSVWKNIFVSFMDELKQSVEFEAGSLFIYESETQTLKEVIKKGEGIDFISTINFPMGSGLSAWVAQKGKVIYLPDIHRGSRHGLNPVRSYLSLPLEINNRIIGVLNLGHVVPNAFEGKNLEKIKNISKDVTRKVYNQSYLNFIEHEENNFIN